MKKVVEEVKKHRRKIAVGVAVVLLVAVIALGSAGAALASRFDGRFLPNTRVAGVDVSGMTRVEAAARVSAAFDAFVGNGFVFVADGKRVALDRASFGVTDPDQTNDIVHLDTDATLDLAYAPGHAGPWPLRVLATGLSLVRPAAFPLAVGVNRASGVAALRSRLDGVELPVQEPKLAWKALGNGEFSVTVVSGKAGRSYDLEAAVDRLERDFRILRNEAIELAGREERPSVTDEEATSLAAAAADHVRDVPLVLTFKDGRWTVPADTRASWIAVKKRDGKPVLGIDLAALEPFLAGIASAIEVTAQDARFEIENDRVVAFEPSREGVAIDRAALAEALEREWIGGKAGAVEIATETAKPQVSTDEANKLGIKEILGVGISNFKGSPVNRIKNIRNSVRKLNGILIKPGEEFSLLKALSPFTAEGGYLPEKVIKGNRIVPEIGGGACQIGTTTFRAAMMSGLPIIERQSHSLAVSYYNDPKNGNPGTDATIYDPSPDFRFLNDTGYYILFLATMNEQTGELRFTFWGTSDGRKGSYSAPTVQRWIPSGETQEIKTTDLAPGTRECQSPFRGADASFTYTVEKPDGTKEERVFTSHYRALPKICMVGVTAEELAGTAPSDGEVIPTADIPAPPPTNTNQ